MELVHVAYINLADNGQCKVKVKPPNSKATIAIQEYPNKFLALATQIVEKLNGESKNGPLGGNSKASHGKNDGDARTYLPWKFENPNNEETK